MRSTMLSCAMIYIKPSHMDSISVASHPEFIMSICVACRIERNRTYFNSSPLLLFMLHYNSTPLLLHAGGDSKRVSRATPMGKAFLPLPYLAAYDQDGSVPLLFDHILAISSCARQAFKNQG